MNDFNECLQISEDNKTAEFWNKIYKLAFPSMVNCMLGRKGKCKSQDYGVDRIIYLENGKTITIEEKVRTEVYSDVALEYISNDKTKSPGWMEKDLSVDYLAYALLPIQTVYLFDWRMLKLAWQNNKSKWLDEYFTAVAENEYYNTCSICIPIDVLQQSCIKNTIIKI